MGADAAGATVNEQGFAVVTLGAGCNSQGKNQVGVDRCSHLDEAGGVFEAGAFGYRQGVVQIHRRVLGVATAGEQGDPLQVQVAFIDALPHGLHCTRDLQAIDGTSPRGRRVKTLPLGDVRPVDPAGRHPQQHLTGTGCRRRLIAHDQHLGTAVFFFEDGAHGELLLRQVFCPLTWADGRTDACCPPLNPA